MRERIGFFDAFAETVGRLQKGGCLLASGERGNLMTIGWGTIGVIWGRPVFVVLVRPSRYSFGLLEALGEFTVNVPREGMERQVALCGSLSGRDGDKAKRVGLSLAKGEHVGVPYVAECPIHYECRVIHKGNVIDADLDRSIVQASYPNGDFHRIYYGEILGVYREKG